MLNLSNEFSVRCSYHLIGGTYIPVACLILIAGFDPLGALGLESKSVAIQSSRIAKFMLPKLSSSGGTNAAIKIKQPTGNV